MIEDDEIVELMAGGEMIACRDMLSRLPAETYVAIRDALKAEARVRQRVVLENIRDAGLEIVTAKARGNYEPSAEEVKAVAKVLGGPGPEDWLFQRAWAHDALVAAHEARCRKWRGERALHRGRRAPMIDRN